ncbi:hypothetical protein SAMN06269185_2818 [Natronoarchaeum philippinense]|uniref:DUF7344 domain-containing protein n=1 Tax=Natronoarchaeum philippinense TaxID=558529 RepID=A0A285P5C0_NATPI|nr:hypothetical protein [Natronoarchaeum philippinense]SNZ16932.1 hypothetical protein SAMN06269185_2818 [Natronoarchaeum philippinense]
MSHPDRDALSQDVVFDLLSSPRRRFVLYYLNQVDGEIEIGELADEVAAWENETAVDDLTSQQRKRVYVSLYQTHVPKMEDAGIIEYDSDGGTVALADQADDISAYLSREEDSRPWQQYYLGLAVAGALFYLVVALGIGPFAALGEFTAGLIIIAAFAATAIVHLIDTQRSGTEISTELIDDRKR